MKTAKMHLTVKSAGFLIIFLKKMPMRLWLCALAENISVCFECGFLCLIEPSIILLPKGIKYCFFFRQESLLQIAPVLLAKVA